jgi:hypothetical protein
MSLCGQWCIWRTLRPWPAPHGDCLEHRIEGGAKSLRERRVSSQPGHMYPPQCGITMVQAGSLSSAAGQRRSAPQQRRTGGAALVARPAAPQARGCPGDRGRAGSRRRGAAAQAPPAPQGRRVATARGGRPLESARLFVCSRRGLSKGIRRLTAQQRFIAGKLPARNSIASALDC